MSRLQAALRAYPPGSRVTQPMLDDLVPPEVHAYIDDADRIRSQMGQFQLWCGKLFWYSGPFLGWRYVGGLPRAQA